MKRKKYNKMNKCFSHHLECNKRNSAKYHNKCHQYHQDCPNVLKLRSMLKAFIKHAKSLSSACNKKASEAVSHQSLMDMEVVFWPSSGDTCCFSFIFTVFYFKSGLYMSCSIYYIFQMFSFSTNTFSLILHALTLGFVEQNI